MLDMSLAPVNPRAFRFTPTTLSRPRPNTGKGSYYKRLRSQSIHIPIPPSLIQSPLLNSPNSIFRRASSTTSLPSKEDEEWLRDTVPLQSDQGYKQTKEADNKEGAPSGDDSSMGIVSEQTVPVSRGRSIQNRNLTNLNVPSSPPLVRWRSLTPPTAPGPWLGQKQNVSRSEPNLTRVPQDYFAP